MSVLAGPRRGVRRSFWSLVVVVLVAVNLRPAVVAVSPVLGRIRDEYGLSAAAAGLLTTIPVLCFGALAPLASRLARKYGLDLTTVVAVAVLTVGSFVRLIPDSVLVFAGTVLIGGGIAIGNVVVPAVVKRDFPARPGPVMGLYSAALSGGAAAAAGLTVPLAEAVGGWRQALAWWAVAVLAVLPVVAVWAGRGRHGTGGGQPAGSSAVRLWRDPLAWQITGFMGLQSFGFYATTAWIPQILVDRGTDETVAGWLLSVAAIAGLVSSLLVPLRATRSPSQVAWSVAACGFCVAGLLGLLLAVVPVVSVVVLGLGQGACLALVLSAFALRSPDAWMTTRLSGMAQTVGYLVAALGPVLTGLLHDASGGWWVPLLMLVMLALVQTIFGALAGRARQVGGAHPG